MMETPAAEGRSPDGTDELASSKPDGSSHAGRFHEDEEDNHSSSSEDSCFSNSEGPLVKPDSAESRVLPPGKRKTGVVESSKSQVVDSEADYQFEEKRRNDETKAAPSGGNVLRGTKEDLISGPNHKPTFAEQLYDALEDEEHHDALQWTQNGKAFTITNPKKFTLYKMSKLFNIRNMSSFVRKLGRWGFTRVHEKQSNNLDVFKHPEFVRGDRSLVKRKVKCMGRLIAAASVAAHQNQEQTIEQQQLRADRKRVMQSGTGGLELGAPLGGYHCVAPSTALRREDDLAMPMRSQGPLYEGVLPFHDVPLNETNSGSSLVLEPSLDRVTDASAASAEALLLSHRSQQQSKMSMGFLGREQQDELNELEIQNLLLQRERQQRELEAQKCRIIWEQQQLAQEAALRSSVYSRQEEQLQMPVSALSGMRPRISDLSGGQSGMARSGARPGISDLSGGQSGMARSGALSQEMSSLTGQQYLRTALTMDQQGLFDHDEQQKRQMCAIQDRRALVADHSQRNRDDHISGNLADIQSSLSRPSMPGVSDRDGGKSLLSRYSLDGGTVLGGGDMMGSSDPIVSFHASMGSTSGGGGGGDGSRAKQRKAVIQALLLEEQEWEMRCRGEVASMNMEQQQQQRQQFLPQRQQQQGLLSYQQNALPYQQQSQNQIRQQQQIGGLMQQQNQSQMLQQQQQMGMGQQPNLNMMLQQQEQQDQNPRLDPRMQLQQLEQLKFQQEQQQLQLMQQQQQQQQHARRWHQNPPPN